MTTQQLAERRAELLRKRWDGTATSEEQDELDAITDTLRKLAAASWAYASEQLQEVEN